MQVQDNGWKENQRIQGNKRKDAYPDTKNAMKFKPKTNQIAYEVIFQL